MFLRRAIAIWMLVVVFGTCATDAATGGTLTEVQALFDGVGLGGVDAVAVSHDGKNVYATGKDDKTLVEFTRNQADGALTYLDSQVIELATAVVVSPDDKFVYAGGVKLNEIKVYTRDSTGRLTSVSSVTNNQGGVSGIGGISALAIRDTATNRLLYAAGSTDSAIAVFTANKSTGALAFVKTIKLLSGPTDYLAGVRSIAISPGSSGGSLYAAAFSGDDLVVCDLDANSLPISPRPLTGIDGLDGPVSIIVSPDNKNVYVAGSPANAIVKFNRNQSTGDLESPTAYRVGGLQGAAAVVVSGDGKHVYAGGASDGAIVRFNRDQTTGDLLSVLPLALSDGLGGVVALALSGSSDTDKSLYAAGEIEDAVVAFQRNNDATSADFGKLGSGKPIYGGSSGIEGLDGANGIAVSPDDRHVYIAALADGALSVFNRNTLTGRLTFSQVKRDGSVAHGLAGAKAVAISPDGAFVYLASEFDGITAGGVTVFGRDANPSSPSFGQLAFVESQRGDSVAGLLNVQSVAVSPDGNHLYAASLESPSGAVAVFRRDPILGTLQFIEALYDGITVQGIAGSLSVAVSPDGAHVYVTSFFDNAVAVFARNTTPGPDFGRLTYNDLVGSGIPGLTGATTVALSPDGRHLYTASPSESAVGVFSRNSDPASAAYGRLTFLEAQVASDAGGAIAGLSGVSSVVVSADGRRVYATGSDSNALVAFDRDADPASPAFGRLTLADVQVDSATVRGLKRAVAVAAPHAVSADGRAIGPQYVCAVASDSKAVSAFRSIRCGDGFADGEQCDDGGKCVGGTSAASLCRADGECPGGVCRPGSGNLVCVMSSAADPKDGSSCTTDADCSGGLCSPAAGTTAGNNCDSICKLRACGNGLRVPGEYCDDSNLTNADGCDSNCTPTGCGNAVKTGSEQCDDGSRCVGGSKAGATCILDTDCPSGACRKGSGALVCLMSSATDPKDGMSCTSDADCSGGTCMPGSGSGCDANCKTRACGNGFRSAGELCDDGNALNGDNCDDDVAHGGNCTPTRCGNRVVTTATGEQCDDGDAENQENKPCLSDCKKNVCGDGHWCSAVNCISGRNGGPEECDDGDTINGNGCDNNCTPTACGNGIVTAGEVCDDGNRTNGDVCDDDVAHGGNCTPSVCGNGIKAGSEQCDDGNTVNGDGCDNNCTLTACGNGIVTAGEVCDDGNRTNGDVCDDDVAHGGNCTPSVCGNGVTAGTEQCDDGNTASGDGCDSNCTRTGCGNGIITTGEVCDDPAGNGTGKPCLATCVPNVCGDGDKCTDARCTTGPNGGPEQCEPSRNPDGSPNLTDPNDNCTARCGLQCGNGITDGVCIRGPFMGQACTDDSTCQDAMSGACRKEACDPGVGNFCRPGGCNANCEPIICGDGRKDCTEPCDLGALNFTPGSGCAPGCQNDRAQSSCRERLGAIGVVLPESAKADPEAARKYRRRKQVCRDGDPCDHDAVAGQCSFDVEIFLGVRTDSACNPSAIDSVDFLDLDVDQCWQRNTIVGLTSRLSALAPAAAEIPLRCKEGLKGKECHGNADCDTYLNAGNGRCDVGTGVKFSPAFGVESADPIHTEKVTAAVPVGKRLKLRTVVRGEFSSSKSPPRNWDVDRVTLVCRPPLSAPKEPTAAIPCADSSTPMVSGTPTGTPTESPTPTSTGSATVTPTNTPTSTPTRTPTNSPTQTPTVTPTKTRRR